MSGSRENGSGDFLIVVIGTAPYLASWQVFKDYLRSLVKEQPGWVHVVPGQSQRRCDMQGWCRLRYKDDVEKVYQTVYNTRGMLVHVWETCRSSGDHKLLRCNCSTCFPGLPMGSHSPGQCGIDIGSVNQLSKKSNALPSTSYKTAHSTYPPTMYTQVQAYPSMPMYAMHAPPVPVYSTSTNGMPVNVRGGAVLTEARGIFIRNLSYQVTPVDLNQLLCTVGAPVDSQLLRDSKTGVFKGAATAKFGSKEEALYAVSRLNGQKHMGMMLQVRMDTDTTVVGRAEPMIVNGSFRETSTFAGSGGVVEWPGADVIVVKGQLDLFTCLGWESFRLLMQALLATVNPTLLCQQLRAPAGVGTALLDSTPHGKCRISKRYRD